MMGTGMPFSAIGELTERVQTWDPRKSSENIMIDYIDIGSVSKDEKRITGVNQILSMEAPSRARQLVKTGDVLISTVRPNLNSVAEVPSDLNGATASTGFSILRPVENKLNPKYLFHWVRSPEFVRQMLARATGANYPAVSDKTVKESIIPLPPLEEQRRIAAILDKADAIRRKRKQTLELTETFLQSIFLDMFGDPVTNPKEWNEEALISIANIKSGVTKGRNFAGKETVYVPYMRVANVQDGYIDVSDVADIEVFEQDIEKYQLEAGDILLTEGGDPDKLGRGAVWSGQVNPCIHQNHIFRVRIDRAKATPEFLSALIGGPRGKRYFLRSAKQTTGIATINITQLKSFSAILPPIELQNRFSEVVKKVGKSIENASSNANEIDNLFNSLVQKAFRGELTQELKEMAD